MSDNDITHQFDPFFAECRAFGCLKECGLDGDAAVHCYGYIMLPPAFESVAMTFGAVVWDRNRASESQPFRGIVKELVSSEVPCFTSQMTKKMKADLLKLSKIGVFARDIRKENYKGGRLTDFSASWTWPHVMLSFKGRFAHARGVQEELFDEMTQGMTRSNGSGSAIVEYD
jgi:Kinetochore Sim4 complex subunit FTA2